MGDICELVALVVVSCDDYDDVARNFFPLLEKYWPDNKIEKFFINNSIKFEYEDVITINAGSDKDWSGRLKCALNDINYKYILFMLEDYYIGEEVDSRLIEKAIERMEADDLKYYRITNSPKGKIPYRDSQYLSGIPNNQPYGINLQSAIWKKDFFLDFLGDDDISAWEVEINQLKDISNKYTHNLDGCVVDTRNIIDIHNGVIKGKWVPETINFFKSNSYNIEIGTREILSYKDRFSLKIKGFIEPWISNNLRKKIKTILAKMGMKFTSEY